MITIDEILNLKNIPKTRWMMAKLFDIQNGVLSNYPPCCIAWYLLRMETTLPLVQNKDWIWKLYYEKFFNKRPHIQHIQCPRHLVTHRSPKYYKCKKCGWKQLDLQDCLKCPQKKKNDK